MLTYICRIKRIDPIFVRELDLFDALLQAPLVEPTEDISGH